MIRKGHTRGGNCFLACKRQIGRGCRKLGCWSLPAEFGYNSLVCFVGPQIAGRLPDPIPPLPARPRQAACFTRVGTVASGDHRLRRPPPGPERRRQHSRSALLGQFSRPCVGSDSTSAIRRRLLRPEATAPSRLPSMRPAADPLATGSRTDLVGTERIAWADGQLNGSPQRPREPPGTRRDPARSSAGREVCLRSPRRRPTIFMTAARSRRGTSAMGARRTIHDLLARARARYPRV